MKSKIDGFNGWFKDSHHYNIIARLLDINIVQKFCGSEIINVYGEVDRPLVEILLCP